MDSAKELEARRVLKVIRKYLRSLHPEEVVDYCIQRLNPGRSFEWTEVMQRPPWLYLVLIKWAIAYGDFLSPRKQKRQKRRSLREKDIEEIFGMLHEIWGKNLPDAYENPYFFFRAQFQQQYWLQEPSLVPEMSRQHILFGNLESDHDFSVAFQRMHGIDLSIFLELSFALISRFVASQSNSIEEGFFANLVPSYPPETIPAFLSLLSRDLESLRRELSALPNRGVLHEIIEPTPLLRFPLFKSNGKYYCYLVHLLFRAVQNYVYNTLRAADAHEFVSNFGPIFERYLERGLSHAGLKYMTENELKKKLPRGSKTVDFTVLSEGALVLIDSKAIQLPELGMLARTSRILLEKVESSALKGIEQGFSVTNNLRNIGLIGSSSPVFLLVVTHHDLLLGHGRDFYENAAKEYVDRLAAAYEGANPIPVEHMFFLSINDFDLLMEHLKSSTARLEDFLQRAAEDNANFRAGKFVFRQHIPNALTSPQFPEYLYSEVDRLGDRLKGRLIR
jgi:hypothetical protein